MSIYERSIPKTGPEIAEQITRLAERLGEQAIELSPYFDDFEMQNPGANHLDIQQKGNTTINSISAGYRLQSTKEKPAGANISTRICRLKDGERLHRSFQISKMVTIPGHRRPSQGVVIASYRENGWGAPMLGATRRRSASPMHNIKLGQRETVTIAAEILGGIRGELAARELAVKSQKLAV